MEAPVQILPKHADDAWPAGSRKQKGIPIMCTLQQWNISRMIQALALE